jgi:hypothetical protein
MASGEPAEVYLYPDNGAVNGGLIVQSRTKLFSSAMCLMGIAFVVNEAAALNINGPGFTDQSVSAGESITKNGPGTAILALDEGSYTIWMGGSGNMYLTGANDYRSVRVTFKKCRGNLIWIPNNEDKACFGPKVEKIDGPGKIRMGTWGEVKKVREGR